MCHLFCVEPCFDFAIVKKHQVSTTKVAHLRSPTRDFISVRNNRELWNPGTFIYRLCCCECLRRIGCDAQDAWKLIAFSVILFVGCANSFSRHFAPTLFCTPSRIMVVCMVVIVSYAWLLCVCVCCSRGTPCRHWQKSQLSTVMPGSVLLVCCAASSNAATIRASKNIFKYHITVNEQSAALCHNFVAIKNAWILFPISPSSNLLDGVRFFVCCVARGVRNFACVCLRSRRKRMDSIILLCDLEVISGGISGWILQRNHWRIMCATSKRYAWEIVMKLSLIMFRICNKLFAYIILPTILNIMSRSDTDLLRFPLWFSGI